MILHTLWVCQNMPKAQALRKRLKDPPNSKFIGAGGMLAGTGTYAIVLYDWLPGMHESSTINASEHAWVEDALKCRLMPGCSLMEAKTLWVSGSTGVNHE